MLLLDRVQGGRIYIGEKIVIELISIKEKHALIGVLAPEELKILRGEHFKKGEIEE